MSKTQTVMADKFKILNYVKASNDPKKDHGLKERIKNLVSAGDSIYVYSSVMPITSTYLHLAHAKIIADMSKSGFKIIVNVLDPAMQTHEIFKTIVLTDIKNSREKINEMVEDFKNLIITFGGVEDNLRFVKLSDLLNRLVTLEKQEILVYLYKILNIEPQDEKIQEYFKNRGKLSFILSDALDIMFAKHLNEILLDFCEKPANMILAGDPKSNLYDTIQENLEDYSLHVLYMPRFPNFKYNRKYLDINFDYIRAYELINNWASDLNEKKIEELHNLYNYYFPLFLEDNLIKSRIKKDLIKADLNEEYKVTLMEDILTNLLNCFKQAKENVAKKNVGIKILKLHERSNDIEKILQNLNEKKLHILRYCDGTNAQSDIAAKCGIDKSTVSIYIKQLEEVGLIVEREDKNIKPERMFDKIEIFPNLVNFQGKKSSKSDAESVLSKSDNVL